MTVPESELWVKLGTPATPEKQWTVNLPGRWLWYFQLVELPVLEATTHTMMVHTIFYSSLDFCGGIGGKLFTVATGKVIFTGLLTVRGNVMVIDYGWDIYTAYDHQSELLALLCTSRSEQCVFR